MRRMPRSLKGPFDSLTYSPSSAFIVVRNRPDIPLFNINVFSSLLQAQSLRNYTHSLGRRQHFLDLVLASLHQSEH